MRWKIKTLDIPIGKSKVVKKFAWLPTQVKGHYVWLEMYSVTYFWDKKIHKFTSNDYYVHHWCEMERELL